MKKIILLAFIPLFGIANLFAQCTATVNTLNVSCFGGNNGSATVNPSGGTAPYTFLWSTGQTTQTANNLTAGTYTVTATDAVNCNVTLAATIIEPSDLNVSVTSIGTDCNFCNGSVTATATGGVIPYTYIWSNGVSGPIITDICEGYYYLAVNDANGCSTNAQSSIISINPINIILDSLNNMNCSNITNGSISIHAVGGSGIYYYQWSGMGFTSNLSSISDLTTPGIYCVTVFDTDSCYNTACYTILNNYNLYASITASNTNCLNNGTAIVHAQGAYPPYTFLWSDSLHQTNDTAVNLSGGNYYVTVADANGCTVTGFAQIYSSCKNVIKGRVYNDINQNCIQDIGEPGIAGKILSASPGYNYAYTDSLGNYTLLIANLNCTVSTSNYYQPYFTPTCPPTGSTNVIFSNLGDTSIVNFGYFSNPNYFDLGISASWNGASPGFQKNYNIYYYNHSPMAQNALLRFYYDSALNYVTSTQGGVHNFSLHQIEWTLNNLPQNYNVNWSNIPQVTFDIPTSVSITDSLYTHIEILPIIGDAYQANNTISVYEPVTGSHDPNSKSVIPRGSGNDGFILQSDSVLLYIIHFQNDGNDTAFTVVVKDTLSPYLDPASIVPGGSSHPYTFELSGQGIITFRFNNILLPDSNVNEPASNGYVNYTIKQKSNNTIGTIIENTAYIYFDFNEAIVTNTVKNTIVSPVSIKEFYKKNILVNVSPNPFTDKTQFTIQTKVHKQKYTLRVFDLLGKNIYTKENIASEQFEFFSEEMGKGIYFYKIYNEQQVVASGKLIAE